MSENGLRKLFRINEIKILISVTGLHNKATYYAFSFFLFYFLSYAFQISIFGADSRIMNSQRWKLAEQRA
jgi:hypothetical protein